MRLANDKESGVTKSDKRRCMYPRKEVMDTKPLVFPPVEVGTDRQGWVFVIRVATGALVSLSIACNNSSLR